MTGTAQHRGGILNRFAVHTITTKPLGFADCCESLAEAGFGGVSIWREAIEQMGCAEARRIAEANGLSVPAFVRGGFFVARDPHARRHAISENARVITQASELGADMVVIVPGSAPDVPLDEGRLQVERALTELLPEAERAGVGLALEPLHPMYAGDRSCVNRLAEARAICDRIDHPNVGVAVDVYHVWWDTDLASEIRLLGGHNRIMAFHVCDWFADTRNRLTDRALMGDGIIDVAGILKMVREAGFRGAIEVEIIGDRYWERDQHVYIKSIAERCKSVFK